MKHEGISAGAGRWQLEVANSTAISRCRPAKATRILREFFKNQGKQTHKQLRVNLLRESASRSEPTESQSHTCKRPGISEARNAGCEKTQK